MLYSRCERGDVETIVSLLDEGKNVNCIEYEGKNPVMLALEYGKLNAAIMLAGRGADLSRVDTYAGRTLLHFAACGGDLEYLEWVFANTDLDVHATDYNGSEPLGWAGAEGHMGAVKLFIDKGANPFFRDLVEESALAHYNGEEPIRWEEWHHC
jgi:ankyrin repeat protein